MSTKSAILKIQNYTVDEFIELLKGIIRSLDGSELSFKIRCIDYLNKII
jgi:hypothetical protein